MSPSLRPPSPAAFPETTAVPCADKPSEAQIIAVTRGRFPIGSGAKASLGPLCAGTWQYTVLSVAGREPLQVVTSGEPTSLKLVSAGTDICTVEVRNYAPAGILLAARC